MKRLILFICAILFATLSYSQGEGWIIAKGALNFAKGLISEEELSREAEVGAMVLGEAFSTLGQWSHEKAVAERGKDQLTIQTPEGEKLSLVRDFEGNFYLQQAGIIYPISKEREQKIIGFTPKNKLENEFIPPYNLDTIAKMFYFQREVRETPLIVYQKEKHYVPVKGKYIRDIAKEKGVDKKRISINYLGGRSSFHKKSKVLKEEKSIPKGTSLYIDVPVIVKPATPPINEIRFVFTCKWIVDFDEDDEINLERDIHGLKNSFLPGEKITFLIGYDLAKEKCKAHMSIYSEFTGNILFYEEISLLKGRKMSLREIKNPNFSPGEYIINIKIRDVQKNILDSYKESFEVRNLE